jgi:hypothetical protein
MLPRDRIRILQQVLTKRLVFFSRTRQDANEPSTVTGDVFEVFRRSQFAVGYVEEIHIPYQFAHQVPCCSMGGIIRNVSAGSREIDWDATILRHSQDVQ